MPDADQPPAASPPPAPDVVASRLQARFDDLVDGTVAPRPSLFQRPGRAEAGTSPRVRPRSDDEGAQRQLDDLHHQLVVLRQQLDVAFDELDDRLEAAEARARLAEAYARELEARASVAESRAAAAELQSHEVLELVAGLEARLSGGESGGSLRGALDRLRGRLDAGSG